MNIAITGFMGTGKTLIGKLLSRRLGWRYFDTDHIIELRTGLRIEDIFARKGEKYFRDLETNTIRFLCAKDKIVISCGGGAVLRKENMDELEKSCIIVCLTAPPEKIYERIKHSNRPLLQVEDPLTKINEMLVERQPYYQRCHIMIDTIKSFPDETVDKILNDINKIINKKLIT